MLTRDYCWPWACCRARADALDFDHTLGAPSCHVHNSHCGPGFAGADCRASFVEGERPLNGSTQLAYSFQQESLQRSTESMFVKSIGQQRNDERINETAIFIESMLLDIKARDLVVTTLDTAASLLPILATSQSDAVEDFSTGTQYAGAINSLCAHEDRICRPAQQNQRGPTADLEASNGPTHRIPAESDPSNCCFLDESMKPVIGSAYGMDNVAVALSAEARLSVGGRPTPPLGQSHATAKPAALGSGKRTQARWNSKVAAVSSLISIYSGRALPSVSSQIEDKYGLVLSRKDASCVCVIQGPGQDCAKVEGVGLRPEQPFPGAHPEPSIPHRAIAAELPCSGTMDDDCTVRGDAHRIESVREYRYSDGNVTPRDVQAPRDAYLPEAMGVATENNSSSRGSNGINMKAGPEPSGLDNGGLQAESPVSTTPLLSILSDIGELSCMAAHGILGGIWLGGWRGMRVAVKLISCTRDCSGVLSCMARASRFQHPNLLTVYDLRMGLVDEASLSELDPPLMLRPDWAAARRPTGRLMRFLAARSELNAPEGDNCRGDASLTLYPGDIIMPRLEMTPGRQALQSVRPRLGGSIVATIMEFCEMGNLQSLACGNESPFRARQFLSLRFAQRALLRTAREVAAGMHALHAAGIVHGSLRPTNVLLSRSSVDRRGFVARVADVGSVSLAYAASNPLECRPCVALLAPEALVDEARCCTTAADVYAFGMLLFVMAAGEMPFQGPHLVAVLMAVASEGLRPQWPAGEHSHLESLFLRCLVQLPSERPSFKQILREICSLEQQIKEKGRGAVGRPVAAPALTAAP